MNGGHINSQCQLKGNLFRRFTADITEYDGSQMSRLLPGLRQESTVFIWPSHLVTCRAAASRSENGVQNQTVADAANPLSALSSLSKKVGGKVAAGVVSGTLQAGIFHPWDRALYLSQTNNRYRPLTSLSARGETPADFRDSPLDGLTSAVRLSCLAGQ